MTAVVRSVTVELNARVAKYKADIKSAGKATDDAFGRIDARVTQLNSGFGDLDRRVQDYTKQTRASKTETKGLGDALGITIRKTKAYSLELAIADERAARFKKSLRDQAKAAVDAELGMESLSDAAVRNTTAMDRSGNAIDRTSGRLALLAKGFAAVGPAAIPIGAVGAAGLGGLAALFGAGAIGAVGLAAATHGVADALEAVQKARLDPTVANIQAARDAMQQISPAAREWVRAAQDIAPVLKGIRDAGAENLFPGVTEATRDFEKLEPILTRFMAAVGQAGGDSLSDAVDSLASERWRPFLEFLAVEAPQAIETTTQLVGSLSHGAAELWMQLDPGNDAFLDWATGVADAFDRYASSKQGREDIAAFLQYARETGPDVAEALAAGADAVVQLVQAAAPLGGPVLDAFTAIAKAIAVIADSPLGTPIMAGVTALSALSLASTVATASLVRLSAAMATVGATSLSTSLAGIASKGGIAGLVLAGLVYKVTQFDQAMETAGDSSATFADKAQAWLNALAPGMDIVDELGLGLGDLFNDWDRGTGTLTKGEDAISRYHFALAKTIGPSKAFSLSTLEAKAALADVEAAAQEAGDSFHNLGDMFQSPAQSLAKFIRETQQAARAAANISDNMAKAIAKGANPKRVLDLYDQLGAGAGLILEDLANGNQKLINSFNKTTGSLKHAEQKISAAYLAANRWGQLEPEARLLVKDLASGKVKSVKGLVDNYGLTRAEAKALLDDLASGKLKQVINLLNDLDGTHTSSTHTHTTKYYIERYGGVGVGPGNPANPTVNADGGLHVNGTRAMANGGYGRDGRYYPRTSQIVRGGADIMWGELETGWEAYISGKPSQRLRNRAIWAEAGRRLGYDGVSRNTPLAAPAAAQPHLVPSAAYATAPAPVLTVDNSDVVRRLAAVEDAVRTADRNNTAGQYQQSKEQRRGAGSAISSWPRGGR